MNIDFLLVLVILVFVSGAISLLDRVYFAKHRGLDEKMPLLIEYSRSFFPILLIVLLLRSFLVEPYRIPSGSLKPTLLVNDFVLVNKYQYGIRLPVLNTKIIKMGEPATGDIAVFHWPVNPSIYYIKRIIGRPGDRVQYVDKTLYINGKKAPQSALGYEVDTDDRGYTWTVQKQQETLDGLDHEIYVIPERPGENFDIMVPPGMYFAMGDNRDASADSREWGFVPEKNLVGRAFFIWLSWNQTKFRPRWQRLGTSIV